MADRTTVPATGGRRRLPAPPRRMTYERFVSETTSTPSSSATPSRVLETGGGTSRPEEPNRPPPVLLDIPQLFALPGREHLPKLDPSLPTGTVWFKEEGNVSGSVANIIRGHFTEIMTSWKFVSTEMQETWWRMFAVQYRWDLGITGIVRAKFLDIVKARINGIVHDWKKAWLQYGDDAKPLSMAGDVWKGLVAHWTKAENKAKAETCSTARNAKDDDGRPRKVAHTTGQKSFLRKKRELVQERGADVPMTEVYKVCHTRKDGSWIDPRAEEFQEFVESRVAEVQTQSSQNSAVGDSVQPTPLTVPEINSIFKQAAPKKKGKTVGFGSIPEIPEPSRISETEERLQTEVAQLREQNRAIQEQNERIQADQARTLRILRSLAGEDDTVANLMRREGVPPEEEVDEPTRAEMDDVMRRSDEELRRNFDL